MAKKIEWILEDNENLHECLSYNVSCHTAYNKPTIVVTSFVYIVSKKLETLNGEEKKHQTNDYLLVTYSYYTHNTKITAILVGIFMKSCAKNGMRFIVNTMAPVSLGIRPAYYVHIVPYIPINRDIAVGNYLRISARIVVNPRIKIYSKFVIETSNVVIIDIFDNAIVFVNPKRTIKINSYKYMYNNTLIKQSWRIISLNDAIISNKNAA